MVLWVASCGGHQGQIVIDWSNAMWHLDIGHLSLAM